ncbi:hypothetical protein ABW19_dt0205421 [Dactylella cylindrospora]|nr:hypothetical protein ABW19_dt0205421 [Dactylella cylindrospora]
MGRSNRKKNHNRKNNSRRTPPSNGAGGRSKVKLKTIRTSRFARSPVQSLQQTGPGTYSSKPSNSLEDPTEPESTISKIARKFLGGRARTPYYGFLADTSSSEGVSPGLSDGFSAQEALKSDRDEVVLSEEESQDGEDGAWSINKMISDGASTLRSFVEENIREARQYLPVNDEEPHVYLAEDGEQATGEKERTSEISRIARKKQKRKPKGQKRGEGFQSKKKKRAGPPSEIQAQDRKSHRQNVPMPLTPKIQGNKWSLGLRTDKKGDDSWLWVPEDKRTGREFTSPYTPGTSGKAPIGARIVDDSDDEDSPIAEIAETHSTGFTKGVAGGKGSTGKQGVEGKKPESIKGGSKTPSREQSVISSRSPGRTYGIPDTPSPGRTYGITDSQFGSDSENSLDPKPVPRIPRRPDPVNPVKLPAPEKKTKGTSSILEKLIPESGHNKINPPVVGIGKIPTGLTEDILRRPPGIRPGGTGSTGSRVPKLLLPPPANPLKEAPGTVIPISEKSKDSGSGSLSTSVEGEIGRPGSSSSSGLLSQVRQLYIGEGLGQWAFPGNDLPKLPDGQIQAYQYVGESDRANLGDIVHYDGWVPLGIPWDPVRYPDLLAPLQSDGGALNLPMLYGNNYGFGGGYGGGGGGSDPAGSGGSKQHSLGPSSTMLALILTAVIVVSWTAMSLRKYYKLKANRATKTGISTIFRTATTTPESVTSFVKSLDIPTATTMSQEDIVNADEARRLVDKTRMCLPYEEQNKRIFGDFSKVCTGNCRFILDSRRICW